MLILILITKNKYIASTSHCRRHQQQQQRLVIATMSLVATAEVHDHPPPPRFLAYQERESPEVMDLTQYFDEWYKEYPNISTPPPPPTFFEVNTIKAAICSHPIVNSTKDLKPITWISLKPLDFSSRDPFGFDCWVHDVIHGFFWFRLNSLYLWFFYILLSIFYCWFFFLNK